MEVINKNDIKQGTVIDLTHEGHGVVKFDRYPIFVPNALIDEDIEFKIIKVKKNFAIGKLMNVIKESENRVEPPCKYYWKCGGCQLQHMTYEAQLAMKKEQVVNLFHRKAQFNNTVINDTVGMNNPWRYRNKSQLPIGKDKDNFAIMGYYRQRSHDIIDMDSCLIQDEQHQEIMNQVKQWLNELKVSIYNEKTKKGLLRHLVIRTGHYTDEIMVIFVTNGSKFKQANILVEKLNKAFPNITSIKQNINNSHSNVIMGQQSVTLYGKDKIVDQLSDTTFKISDQSFYQINSSQTEKLYQKAIDYAQLDGEETVLDTYCGIGTIGLYMAPVAKHVYGVEVVPSAIKDAQQNATLNQLENTTFVCGKAEDVIIEWKQQGIKPDVVMVDPPRKGCDETFLDTLLTLNPKRIVYISCNPSTQQRDAQILATKYHLKEITPVDMFPQTTHIETVALFERLDNPFN
ncbi:23S rRNA (uracil(1939)-C(5))-methyltransferase RlmD [Staphylococcus devriesei]|uniref:23S rRNA (Uracil(1939)-C(5))-methyltransferase RlmD n=1 Tax=Staphylococcus devriesei TaxID=586733 RepID=A0A2K4DM74_9STAP|nr:23S rRNA (uracil(1939)-C(5))-methyltransferase RlmD [Staphylococcus devriesei]MCE5090960.1 23S rRNA (uracil(1939)-C(5))-methyltransferase RlmD [Staphylococcus devriesei]MCE5098015.1 23S rRNA (uracil(1939)-C(5))-methyltransferase RlmD [Staphylococcus devriesei]PNZ87916.1 23S rRNA (uracil(1939)-C(5))-methyltransferase RlmD [Staphylococcus devriesei]PTE72995.1 23S rRNA (uracil(1939)-C(5))-methyltransferase RlmD [Staphylococcus devriesei]PTF04034.1 23S rRNA (uracil(1939)-C(5))-methyltransferase